MYGDHMRKNEDFKTTLVLPRELAEAVDSVARAELLSRTAFIRRAVAKAVKEQERVAV